MLTVLAMLLTLCAVACWSMLLVQRTGCDAGAAPVVVLCGSALAVTAAGMLGAPALGAAAVYLGAAVCAVLALRKEGRAALVRLYSPAFLFFVVGAVFFIVLFAVRQPMLYQWDEFTFWGSAARATCVHNELYTTAPSNMITRAYPPLLPAAVYLFQWLVPGFSEWAAYAAYDIIALAGMAAVAAGLSRRRWPAGVLVLASCALLPLFFEVGAATGAASNVYLNLQSDLQLGCLFAAALGLYFTAKPSTGSLVRVLVVILALSMTKDMGFALGLIAAGLIFLDLVFQGRSRPRLFGCKKAGGPVIFFGLSAIVSVVGWAGWSAYVGMVTQENRFDLAGAGDTQRLSPLSMLGVGLKELLGIGRTQEFSDLAASMNSAFFTRPVCLLGGGAVVAVLVLALLAAAFVLGGKAHRRRVAVFALGSTAAFAAYWVFHLFLYLYVFDPSEGLVLKDYARYFLPFYLGWLLGAAALLLGAGKDRAVGFAAAALLAVVGGSVLWRGQTVNNFATYSNTFYGERLEVQSRAEAVNALTTPDDVVYPVCQGSDGTRWYYYSYELDARLARMYGGGSGTGQDPFLPTTACTLTDAASLGAQQYEVVTEQLNLAAYLKECGATVLLLDITDEYVAQLLQPYAGAPLPELTLDAPSLWRIVWDSGEMRLCPLEQEAP